MSIAISSAQSPELSEEGRLQQRMHDYLFGEYSEGRETVFRGEGAERGLKELLVMEEELTIGDGYRLDLPEGSEQVAVLFRHFAFRGQGLDQIAEVRVHPMSPDKAPPRSAQVENFYRVQMPTIPPEFQSDPQPMQIEFLMKDPEVTCQIESLAFIAQKAIAPEFDDIPYRDLGAEHPREAVAVRIDTQHELAIGGSADLQREKFFRLHETPGNVDPSFEKWVYERGFLPGRGALKFHPALTKGWGGMETLKEDTENPGAADLSFFERYDAGVKLNKSSQEWGDKDFAMTFNDWPHWMAVPLEGRGTPLIERFDEAAELAAAYAADQIRDAGRTATWWEVKNESSVKSEWAHHWQEKQGIDGWGLLADFHNRVADAVHTQAEGVKVGGPSSAYMQLQVKDFSLYQSQARFIEETRGHLDFFSHHFYENANMLGAYERRGMGYSNYLLGRYEAILDMLRAHMHRVDNVLPILITECGSLQNGRKPSDNWLRLLAWNAFLTKSMQRPDQIDLFVPFIFLHMPWNPNSGDAAFSPKPGGQPYGKIDDFEPTTIARFFDLWKGFDGQRLPVSHDRRWLDVVAVHRGSEVSVAITNMGGRQISVDLSELAGISQAHQTRLNYHKGEVVYQEAQSVDPKAIPVDVNETTVVRLELSDAIEPQKTLKEERNYAYPTAVKYSDTATSSFFPVTIPQYQTVVSAQLRIGIHRRGGIDVPVRAKVNGHAVEIAPGDASEFTEFFAPLDVALPAEALSRNTLVEVMAQPDTTITSVQIVTKSLVE